MDREKINELKIWLGVHGISMPEGLGMWSQLAFYLHYWREYRKSDNYFKFHAEYNRQKFLVGS